ncbi:MAG: hypothetical protein M5U28_19355 [Sandaracinaceae bacterium]|nr:hypothetical protein [Sandaracinaceae bacterium]
MGASTRGHALLLHRVRLGDAVLLGRELGACSAPTPSPETCNGADDDCDGAADEDDVCEVDLLHLSPSSYAPPRSTDVDGDARADVCARGYSGVRCWRAIDGGFGEATTPVPWETTAAGPTSRTTRRSAWATSTATGAPTCARAPTRAWCARSRPARASRSRACGRTR